MFIASDEGLISEPLVSGEELTRSSLMGANEDSCNGVVCSASGSFGSPNGDDPAAFTDVNVVPEQEKNQIEETVQKLEEEIGCLRRKERSFYEKRRAVLNKILDIKGCIRVFCRVRPFLSIDKRRSHLPISVESEKILVGSGGSRKEFGFDKVFPQETSQENVFIEVEPILRSAIDGHNVCILAYGQTGTGKTFTMDGTTQSPGIIPRVLEELFHQCSLDSSNSFTFTISMLEVYLGSLRDLLAPKPSSRAYAQSKCNLNVQTDSKGSVEIEGLTEVEISNSAKASWWYCKGKRVRSTSWTNVNESSSRSHCLTRITIYRLGEAPGGKTVVSKLWMVDLGGSERLLKTGATGQTLDEGRAINLSLSALGDVIAALRRKKGHVPYRNSKLTQILKDSLGNGSKVLMLIHVSPYEEDVGETTCSFTFAKRARAVECTKESSEEQKRQKEKRIAELEEDMKESEEECQKLRNQIEHAVFLLNENKELLLKKYKQLEDEERTPESTKEVLGEVLKTPRESEKPSRRIAVNSMPHFMTSTAASRLRKNAAEKEIGSKTKTLRSWGRNSVQASGSQSISYTDHRLKVFIQNSDKRSRYAENINPELEITRSNCTNSKPSPAPPQSRIITSCNPNWRTKLGHHRRRMSDFM